MRIPRLPTLLLSLTCLAAGILIGSRLRRPPAAVPESEPSAACALDRILPEVNLDGVPFDKAIRILQEAAHVRIRVEPDTFSPEMDPQLNVTFRAHKVRLAIVLEEILNQLANDIDFGPVGEDILIADKKQIVARTTIVHNYDIRDLLPPDPPTPPSAGPGLFRRESSGPAEDFVRELRGITFPGDPIGAAQLGGRVVVIAPWRQQRTVEESFKLLRSARPVSSFSGPPNPGQAIWNPTLNAYVSTDDSTSDNALRRRIPEVRLDHVTFAQAVDRLRQLSHANLAADQDVVDSTDSQVTLDLKDISLADALDALMHSAQQPNHLFFGPRGAFILVTYDPNKIAITHAYDVQDLFAGTSAGSSLEAAEVLIRLIENSVDPDHWMENGATMGTINALGDVLIIRQSWLNHEKIRAFLAELRRRPPVTRPNPDS